ncbi:MAG: PEGA domain-containing protein [Bacteroidales bacterium]|nr:PEGA domain-containing protein [Bacteroidales bacterium]
MKRLILFVSLIICSVAVFSQQLKVVEPLRKDVTDTKASKFSKKDYSGNTCGLILLGMVIPDAKFEGDIIHTEYKDGEWWIYMSPGANWLTIKTQYYRPLLLEFDDPIETRVTYRMAIDKPDTDSRKKNIITNQYLVISTTVSTARIYIDGEYVGNKEVEKLLSIGVNHTYRIEAPMYYSEEGNVILSDEKKTELNISLKPAFGYLSISTLPANAKVEINGKTHTSPLENLQLTSGEYTVFIYEEMYKEHRKDILIKDGETTNISVDLEPNFALAIITTKDRNADIYIDGERKGKDKWKGQLSVGDHKVEIKKQSHKTYDEIITSKAGDEIEKLMPSLEPIVGVLNVTSTPTKAKILIDGKDYGTTPSMLANVLVGERIVEISKDGYETKLEKVMIEENKEVVREVILVKKENKTTNTATAKNKKQNHDYFLMANVAYSVAPQISYGITFGNMLGNIGWYTSVAFGGNSFKALFATNITYDPEGYYPGSYTEIARFSATGGMLIKLSDIISLKIGAGYGLRNYARRAYNDYNDDVKLIKVPENSYDGIECSIGSHLSFGRVALSLDLITIPFKYSEIKLGIGIAF